MKQEKQETKVNENIIIVLDSVTFWPCSVRGIKGLRVVDSSVIPSTTTGDTYATQIMIAEKAADMIRDKDTVKAIKDYFKHLIESRHKKIMDDEDLAEEPKEAEGAKKH